MDIHLFSSLWTLLLQLFGIKERKILPVMHKHWTVSSDCALTLNFGRTFLRDLHLYPSTHNASGITLGMSIRRTHQMRN
ncbi:hypothetical protein IFM47457_04914 [Aspergillus lentulus]|nr:hypothetical protein IFM47457_04914 [Aspergillus lentulus]